MALSHQIRKRRREQRLTLAELAQQAQVSKGYLSRLEHNTDTISPSADVLSRIAIALGTSVDELLEKQQVKISPELTDIPEELRTFALTEHLSDEDIRMLARIAYRGRRPRTVNDWRYIFESIKRSVALGTSVGELLEKGHEKLSTGVLSIPKELQTFALVEHLSDEDIKVLAQIEYRGRQLRTEGDWRFIYESIKRSVSPEIST